jgi:hypothetical protein
MPRPIPSPWQLRELAALAEQGEELVADRRNGLLPSQMIDERLGVLLASRRPEALDPTAERNTNGSPRLRLRLAEDYPGARFALGNRSRELGHVVVEALNGPAALAAASAFRPDVAEQVAGFDSVLLKPCEAAGPTDPLPARAAHPPG